MMELSELLKVNGIRKAVVIDDVFDHEPCPDELKENDWSTFFDDLGESDHEILANLYTGYENALLDDLKSSQEFISVVWKNRDKLPDTACDQLFRDYEITQTTELNKLNALVVVLKNWGLTCTTMGRELDEEAKEANLIIVDLFLGYQQFGDDIIDRAVKRVEELVKDRVQNPPLVILMSQSPQLRDKRNDFRDKAGLLGSTFRVVRKSDLEDPSELERLLRRLASHYEDIKRVAGFVHAWDTGLDQARRNFIRLLRRLDLSDLAQIRALLLEFEQQKLGEYLLDVADRVLQHEIECDNNTIGAALDLNRIDLSKYPAPHLADLSDLQDLVHRMVFMHPDRLRLSEDAGKVQLNFGDLLRWKGEDETVFSNDVSLVVTPACDLVRDRVERVMLLSGKLERLEPKNWSYRADPVRTAIVILLDGDRKWIKWNLKDVKSLSWNKLDDMFRKEKKLSRIGRLRELYAIEIQQKMLADLGRIGQPANLPVPFPIDVSLFYVDTNSKAQKIDIEEIESANCYVGRDEDSKSIHRLILTEQACDCIERAVRNLDKDKLHPSAQDSLVAVKKDSGFFLQFERGEIEISPEVGGTKNIPRSGNKVHAAIIRGGEFDEGSMVRRNIRKAALIIKVTDLERDEVG